MSSAKVLVVLEGQQPAILKCQQKWIKEEGSVATLSAFPFFLLEYLGADKIAGMMENRSVS